MDTKENKKSKFIEDKMNDFTATFAEQADARGFTEKQKQFVEKLFVQETKRLADRIYGL